jgi:V/A-type H+-transporting ATPase subunit D
MEITPTRSAVLELAEERRAMHEGYVFLDEKCLVLAGEMLLELRRYAALADELAAAHERAVGALVAAVARHGLEGLSVQPATPADAARLDTAKRSLMGVPLVDASWVPGEAPADSAPDRSPEGRACRDGFVALARACAEVAAVSGNLARLFAEYRRAVRRARALQDVLLPEADRTIAELDVRLAELEQEEAIMLRRGRR